MRIFLSAYACEPGKGSEPGVGWNWALRLSRVVDLTVVTRAKNRPAIVAALQKLGGGGPRFLYYDLPWARWMGRKWLPVRIYYLLWQAMIPFIFDRAIREADLVHHLTFNSFMLPGFWWHTRRPIVLGPLGGGMTCPTPFLRLFGLAAPLEVLRSGMVATAFLNPSLRLSCRRARRILVANVETLEILPRAAQSKASRMLETGIEAVAPIRKRPIKPNSTRVIWAGSLIKRKAAALALRAFARARKFAPGLTLTMLGDGPDGPALRRLASHIGISPAVTWAGRVSHDAAKALIAAHDVFLFTSLRDTSGNVLLEAMAAGLPVVTLNHHGAAEITSDTTAVRVLPKTVLQAVDELASGLQRMAEDPNARHRLGTAARLRVQERFLWDGKAEAMAAVYEQALIDSEGTHPLPPDPSLPTS